MRVFSVPISAPFLRTVISALVDGRLVAGFKARNDPAKLANATLYLPTRRAGRLAREVFLDVLDADAAVLPRIVALGDIDEDELAFAGQSDDVGGAAPLDIPPKLGELERRLTLAHLVAAWAKTPVSSPLVVGGPASTLQLAGDLARLMDDMVTRGVDWRELDRLVPDQLDKYWQHSLEFLRIARDAWPNYLKEIGRIEPAARRDLLIEAEAARLTAHHAGPVIAAGSTGSMPATAKFLHAVAKLPNGAVVLPGLDTDLDEDSWDTIGGERNDEGRFTTPPSSNHPQFAMHALLDRFGIKRRDVESLAAPAPLGREVLVSETMRPSTATAQWHDRLERPEIVARISAGMTNLSVVEAPNPEMEALAIAVAMREARHLGKSAALVTPDRALARRVTASLTRWNLEFDDSGGDALIELTRRVRPPHGRGGGKGTGAVDAARAAQASAVPARRRAWRTETRDRSARTRRVARHAAASRNERLGARFRALPRRADKTPERRDLVTARGGAARAVTRPRAQPGAGPDCETAGGAGAARKHGVVEALRFRRTGLTASRFPDGAIL